MTYHEPVLLKESITGLNIDPEGTYVDVTYGGGGHARAILEKLGSGRLIAFDQDPDATGEEINDNRLILINQNFGFLKNYLKLHNAIPVNGLLADLGISSHQIDSRGRGFSTRFDDILNMRMDKGPGPDAKDILRNYSREELIRLFRDYGEITNAGRLASAIVQYREHRPITTTGDLKEAIGECIPRHKESKYLARVFQALRIAVNNELEALKELLMQCNEAIAPGGRLVVISYHSLEDRLVKHFMRSGNFEDKIEKDIYGNYKAPFRPLPGKAIKPSDEEIKKNPRARSARMRIAEKTA